jgi:PiT family inorganic phosphate transporter
VLRAGFLVGLLGLAGAVLQGANVTSAVGTALIDGVSLTAGASTVGLLTAAALVAVGVFAGYPIATAFTVTGAVVGVGLALGGEPAWAKYAQIVTLWTLTPFVGGGVAYATARLLRAERTPESVAVPALAGLVGLIFANVGFTPLAPGAAAASVAGRLGATIDATVDLGPGVGRPLVSALAALAAGGVVRRGMVADPEVAQRRFLLVLGGLVAFSAGGSQVGLAVGPLVPLLGTVALPLPAVLVGGGLGLLLGSWTGAPRMIKALAQDYSALGPRRSIAALIPSFAIAQTAVAFGVPVSFNEIVVSAIVGSGYAAGGSGVSRRKMLFTVLAWIGSLALALALAYGAFSAVAALG